MQSDKRPIRRVLWAATGFVLAAMLGLSFEFFVPRVEAQSIVTTRPTTPIETAISDEIMMAYQESFRRVAQTALPVVVKIDVVDVIRQQVNPSPCEVFLGPRPRADKEPPTTE